MGDEIQRPGATELDYYVYEELRRIADECKALREGMTEVKVEIAKLQVKSGLWGFVAGAIPGVIAIIWQFVRK